MTKRLLLLLLSLVALGILWWKTGWADLVDAVKSLDGAWFVAALLMFVPQTWLSGVRWSWIVGAYQPLGAWKATELVLASSTLNIVLPSKMGDVAKGAFLARGQAGGDLATGLTLGLFEKGLDTAALAAVMLVATAFAPPVNPLEWFLVASALAGTLAFLAILTRPVAARLAPWATTEGRGLRRKLTRILGVIGAVVLKLRAEPARFATILVSAVVLWTLHLIQFSFALRAAGGDTSTVMLWSRVPMAIFLGLLPFTFAGVGTRDAAMRYLLAPTIGVGPALALGLFATLRYVIVAVAGAPFVVRLPVDRAALLRGRSPAKTSDP